MAYRRTAEVQARLDAQRGAVLAAATELLAEHGYTGCSIASVARRAGIASGTVYNHFGSKAELVGEVFRTVVSREVTAVREAIEIPASAGEQVTAIIETFSGRAFKSPRLAYAMIAEPVDAGVDLLRLRFATQFRDLVAGVVAIGVERGELPPQDAGLVSAALVGAIAAALVGPLATRPEPGTVPSLIGFALRAIGA